MRKRKTREAGRKRRPADAAESTTTVAVPTGNPHCIEEAVQRELMGHSNLRFSSLVVRRIENGVCLEGVLESDSECPDVCDLAQRVAGVEAVLNHLVVRRPPPKG